MNMRFFLSNTKSDLHSSRRDDLEHLAEQGAFKLYGKNPVAIWEDDGSKFVALGRVIGIRDGLGLIETKAKIIDIQMRLQDPNLSETLEGRYVVFKFAKNGDIAVWTDKFGRLDIYYQQTENETFVASGLDFLPASNSVGSEIDDVGLMQSLYIYGGRPMKKHTWFKQVKRLGVSEILKCFADNQISLEHIEKNYSNVMPTTEAEALNNYAETFIEAIRSRASENGNVVFLSSGWDSTSILATLIHLFGKSKTRAVIGRMKYSERSGVCNAFEMERASKIAEYFGVRLDVVDLDYRTGAQDLMDRLSDTYKPQHFCNLTGWNHWMLAEFAAQTSSGGEVVFAGEMSDGAHNFGFSQYASIFHPNSYDFREYSDKMASYLFGPTFLNVLVNNAQNDDPVWKIFHSSRPADFFEELETSNLAIKGQFLKSFFLRSGRMPLAANNSKLLSSSGRSQLDDVTFKTYLEAPARELTAENLYATYLDLYNSFHWQGSTVSTLYHALGHQGLDCALPFHDTKLIEFLSSMPESYGRGLELKPTKYPLKWMLANKIDYPMSMQTGPHSYTYDVNPNFTHIGELINHSSLRGVFQDALSDRSYNNFLSPDSFNLRYIDNIVDKYLGGTEILGAEQTDLTNLAMHTVLSP